MRNQPDYAQIHAITELLRSRFKSMEGSGRLKGTEGSDRLKGTEGSGRFKGMEGSDIPFRRTFIEGTMLTATGPSVQSPQLTA